ncbi:hypothetical protein CROQUDRAFT_97433 [Cronartium quercuum f. sp. fusiforme G11]|uniref:Uncharacterized protein n=1 Tax=Cronartium quercuum f. sp. fusiforme G11 TaxID=708437 RepID=A0A9P6T7Z0_9BASI|nr:hypothetical protein CROQUDRAFT_97433 [Cronartium quercuum f. sp. fusiforme G11]
MTGRAAKLWWIENEKFSKLGFNVEKEVQSGDVSEEEQSGMEDDLHGREGWLRLGTKSNGKLKASEWHALFAHHLLLATIDVFIGNYEIFSNGQGDDYSAKLLMNFVALVECTHLVGSREVSPGDLEKFKQVYNKYTFTSKVLDPDCSIKPNHHYAKHIGSQLEWWGPLLGVAEFAGKI